MCGRCRHPSVVNLDVLDLTLDLCRIPSVTDDEADVADAIASHMRRRGLRVKRQQVGDRVGRDNLLITADDHPIDLLFTTHIDTVPPFIAPVVEGDILKGRGVIDAKGIAAAMMVAWSRLLSEAPALGQRIGLLLVVGEETNSDGAKQAAASGFAPAVAHFINGEPTDGKLCRAMKGVLAFELSVVGQAAHSAYPEAGHSATHQLIDDLARLRAEVWPNTEYGPTTLNVGTLQGGLAANVIAPYASAKVMMRPTVPPEELLVRIRALLHPSTQLVVKTQAAPLRLHTVDGEDTCVVAFGSDVPHLSPLLRARQGSPMLFGPGSILDAHTDHEHVAIADLHLAVDAYQRMARRLLEQP
jgi:acetylornithine deacetylase